MALLFENGGFLMVSKEEFDSWARFVFTAPQLDLEAVFGKRLAQRILEERNSAKMEAL